MGHGKLFMDSWLAAEGQCPTAAVLEWVAELNRTVAVDVGKTTLAATKWFYDPRCGQIVNERRAFFQISGFRNGDTEQPIIIQNEIGFLGILCKPIHGLLHFLIQAKIEPGNSNKIQLSPTIQATKSNFTRMHGGARPDYLDWFLNADKQKIVVDQIQSEQSSRFFGKRNRNIIVMLEEDTEVEEHPSHKWLTLGQIKRLMRMDNLVNMDMRTVLSCIPFYRYDFAGVDNPLARSLMEDGSDDVFRSIYRHMNNYKMFGAHRPELLPLYSLKNWEMTASGSAEEFVCKTGYPFKIIFCDISMDGREVRHWGQPLFEALGMATFGLFSRVQNGVTEFLVRAKPEPGCFDGIELGPTVQLEAGERDHAELDALFLERCADRRNVLYDVMLSEEGGRFYCERNRNIIVEIEPDLLSAPPPGYWWCTYRLLNKLVQVNNILNIQLRNVLSLLIL